MNQSYSINNLTSHQRNLCIQRLTALWAFAESGLGGVLHALQMPFTGLVVGGLAILIITLIAKFSAGNYKQIFKSLLIVLLIKATISPYTPFPAYIAVSFQALIGYVFFSILSVNFISILLLSILAMLESAIQKLLILTLFFGQSFWNATNALFDFIAKQFHYQNINGNLWLITVYLLIYFIGGLCVSWFSYKTIHNISSTIQLPEMEAESIVVVEEKQQQYKKKLWITICLLSIISIILFVTSPNKKEGWLAITKTLSWSLAVILIWLFIITPLLTKLITQQLKDSKKKYHKEVSETLSVLPIIKKLSHIAWQQTQSYKGFKRIGIFVSTLLYWTLTYSESTISKDIE